MNEKNHNPITRNHWVTMANNDILDNIDGGSTPDHFMTTYISPQYPQAEKFLLHHVTKGIADGATNYVLQYRGVILTTCAIAAGRYAQKRDQLWPVHPLNLETGKFLYNRQIEHSLYCVDEDGSLG